MFTSKDIRLHLNAANCRKETINNDTAIVAAVRWGLEPLTRRLAKELGPEVAEHCFTRQGKIRDEVTQMQFRVRIPPQSISVRMAEDVDEHAALRRVRFTKITVTKRGELKGGAVAKKGKKIAPQQVTLRVTIDALLELAEKTHRTFIAEMFGTTLFYTCEPEAGMLPFDGSAVPEPDEDAGDVLDDQAELELKPAKTPKLKKGKRRG